MIPPEAGKEPEYPPIIDADLILLFSQIHAFLNQGLQQKLVNSPVSADGLWFLSTIMTLGGKATPSQLAHWMVRKPNTISSMTKRLEEKGYIIRKKISGTNNRVYLKIMLTEKGEQFLKKEWGTALITAIFSRFTLEEKQTLRTLLLTARKAAAQEISGYEEPPFPSCKTESPDWYKLRE